LSGSHYQSVVSFLLQVDRDILLYILPVDFFFSIAVVAVLARGRRPLELLSMFMLSFTVLFVLASLLFTFVFDRPFALLEVYSF
jgi:hypothetical protein